MRVSTDFGVGLGETAVGDWDPSIAGVPFGFTAGVPTTKKNRKRVVGKS